MIVNGRAWLLVLGFSVIWAAPAAAATKLRLYSAGLDFDPNGNVWHLAAKVCNKDQADSGSILYQLRLYQGDPASGAQYFKIGGFTYKPLIAGKCYNSTDVAVKVKTKDLPLGEYKIVLWLGDYNGSTFSGHPVFTFDKTFIRSNNP